MFGIDIFELYKKTLPPMSRTEYEALMAGTLGFDAELFQGKPYWKEFFDTSLKGLTREEQAFINGPCQELCEMIDDYDINHDRADLPDKMWDFIKKEKFFGMIIPEEYGGLGFTARGHSEVVMKLASRSIAVAVTVMVPNSLGPAELLLHYGTNEEKNYYLPRLARGKEIPCFALTSPYAGSDAASIPDTGYIGRGQWEGEEVLGLYLNFNKRYITLAPIATLMGLAVKVEDPHDLISTYNDGELAGADLSGITVCLIPTGDNENPVPGLDIGMRHNPLDIHFMNGPVRGKDVFIPLKYILGGPKNIGKGWKMLMECLSVGRAISLPSLACAGGKKAVKYVGAYARVRKQFKLPIGKFEGVEEALARIVGLTHIMDCTRKITLQALDMGKKPSVLSAICKYHLTEMNRQCINDAMDVTGGSGICLGQRNLFGKNYQSVPISITVEGANILTRNMIIFGQGAVRNHPYVFDEMSAVQDDEKDIFNDLLNQHIKYVVKNGFRGLMYNFFGPLVPHRIKFVKHLNRFSATFAFITDITMLLLQGSLKRKERISARLGDILSYMYMLACVKHFEENKAYDIWAKQYLQHRIQESFYALLQNYPNKYIGWLLLKYAFPYGRVFKAPDDKLDHSIATIIQHPGQTRDKLTENVFLSENGEDQTAKLEHAFNAMDLYDEIERIVLKTNGIDFEEKADNAAAAGLITQANASFVKQMYHFIRDVVQVDDYEAV